MSQHSSLREAITAQLAEACPRRPFLTLSYPDKDNEVLTYPELIRESEAQAGRLHHVGLEASERIIIILPHSQALYTSFTGALLLGAVPSLFAFPSAKLSETVYFEAIETLVQVNEASMIVTYHSLAEKLSPLSQRVDSLRHILSIDTLAQQPCNTLPQNTTKACDTAFIQYSSGTTGIKKGVAISHDAILWQIEQYAQTIGLSGDDTIASWLPLYHDMGLIACYFLPLLTGTPLVALSPFDWVKHPASLLEVIDKHRASLCWLPNFAYNFLAERCGNETQYDLSCLRGIVNCSEPIMASSHDAFINAFQKMGVQESALACSYAMAENTFAVTSAGFGTPVKTDQVNAKQLKTHKIAKPAYGDDVKVLVSSGRALAGTELLIVDEQGHAQPERAVGEILINAPCLFQSYLNNPEANATAFNQGYYCTGDLGYLAEGELYVVGRKKDLLILHGKNIFPQDIEAIINQCDGIIAGRNVAISITNTRSGTEELVVLVESHLSEGPRQQSLKQTICKAILAQTEVAASEVIILPHQWLIKSTSGKLSRAGNKEKYLAYRNSLSAQDHTSASEASITDKIKKILIAASMGALDETLTEDTSLFLSGRIDSLSVAKCLTEIESCFQITLPDTVVSDLGQIDTISAMTALIGQCTATTGHTQEASARSGHWHKQLSAKLLQATPDARYRLAPQLRDTDHMHSVLHPIVGRRSAPHFQSQAANTDKHGCRVATREKNIITYDDFFKDAEKVGIITGNSTAFGVGASEDSQVCHNRLSTLTQDKQVSWYNFSLRASSLKEEWLATTTFCERQPDYFVWVSGANDLIIMLANIADSLAKTVTQGQSPAEAVRTMSPIYQHHYQNLLHTFETQIATLAETHQAHCQKILFCLQPTYTWIEKPSPEEEAILIELFDRPMNRPRQQVTRPALFAALHQPYSNELLERCRKYGVDFLDLNVVPEMTSDAWLFVDRQHLTDSGHDVMASAIHKALT